MDIISFFIAGDVMLGRAIDQIFEYHSDPTLYESFNKNATDYLPDGIKRYLKQNTNNYYSYDYVWCDLFINPLFFKSDLKLINLETSVTQELKPFRYSNG